MGRVPEKILYSNGVKMKLLRKLLNLTLIVLFFSSCSSVTLNGEARFRLETIGNIKKNCNRLTGKEVVIRAKYMGWNCSAECNNPGITRSDSCIVDSTGCIYLRGTGGLNPLIDRGKEFLFKGVVKEFNNICYLKVVKADEIR